MSIVKATQSSCVTGCRKMPLQRLEPCASKDARTVLRGLGAGNRARLPDGGECFSPRSSTGSRLYSSARKPDCCHELLAAFIFTFALLAVPAFSRSASQR